MRPEDLPVRPARVQVAAFAVDGRFSARQGETRHHANFSWHHAADRDEILITTPLGQGVAELVRDARGARLVTADRQTVEAEDWESLSARIFGFPLPLSGLPRWLPGDVPARSLDDRGRPETALAEGWTIRYLDYESDAPDALPVLVEFQREDMELRLKVDAWQLD
ncbi:Outer-membrane lipoprotein LolB [Rhodocyclaceae bacterium]|nr:Outer-membrane lipoprotein LolB [Rhodocyclaceae bacterium]